MKLKDRSDKHKTKKKKEDEWELGSDSDHPVHEKYTEEGLVKE